MRSIVQLLKVAFTVLLFTHRSTGIGVPSFAIPVLVEQSDLVVVGRVIPLTRSASQQIEVHSYLKNKMEGSSSLITLRQLEQGQFTKLTADRRGDRIFFLRLSEGAIEFTNPFFDSLPTLGPLPANFSPLVDRIVSMQCEVLKASSLDSDRLEALGSLRKMNNLCISPALNQASDSPNEAIKLGSISELIQRGDTKRLPDALSVALSTSPIPSYLRDNLAFAIRDGVNDPTTLPQLYQMIASPYEKFHQAALIAISRIGTPAAVPGLISALNDGDKLVRYSAVIGLSKQFPDGPAAPSLQQYYENEPEYLNLWSAWTASHVSGAEGPRRPS